MTKTLIPQESGDLVAVDIMEDFAKFPMKTFSIGTRVAL